MVFVLRRAASLLLMAWLGKAVVFALRVLADGRRPPEGALALAALAYEDVMLAAAYLGIAAALVVRGGRRARFVAHALYLALAFICAANVPLMRVMSSPFTAAFVHAAGSALSDSIALYLTPSNLLPPVVLAVVAAFLPDRLPNARPPAWMLAGVAGLAVFVGPLAVKRIETLGLHRNPVVALASSLLPRASSPASPCAAREPAPATDLSHLAGSFAGRSVVWIVLESTAARYLPPWGGRPELFPHLNELASHALVAEQVSASYPESIKGLYGLLCSRAPVPGVPAASYDAPAFACPSVAERLRQSGYRTGLFHSGRFAYLGMRAVVNGRGFDTLADAADIPSAHASSFGVDDASTVRALLAWIDRTPREAPFFAVYMPIAGHHPYQSPGRAPGPLPERHARDAYLNDLHAGDDAIGALRAGLRARGLDERTLYVVMGDHGQAFEEHEGNFAHALFLYEENLHVPFFLAAPGAFDVGLRAPQPGSLLDAAPTTLAALGLTVPAAYEGRSIFAPATPRVVRFATEQAVRRAGVRDGRWKLLLDRDAERVQLFDLATDPEERRDLAAREPAIASYYRRCL